MKWSRPERSVAKIGGVLGARLKVASGALLSRAELEELEGGGGPAIITGEDADTMASTICEPDSPLFSVNPREVPLWVEETTLYSTELAIHEGTSCVTKELYPFRGV